MAPGNGSIRKDTFYDRAGFHLHIPDAVVFETPHQRNLFRVNYEPNAPDVSPKGKRRLDPSVINCGADHVAEGFVPGSGNDLPPVRQ